VQDNFNQYYQILGLRKGASEEEIKEAYKDLVKVWHPDRFTHDPDLQKKAEEKLKVINFAYERLIEYLEKSRAYSYKEEQTTTRGTSNSGGQKPPPPHTNANYRKNENSNDVDKKHFFGRALPGIFGAIGVIIGAKIGNHFGMLGVLILMIICGNITYFAALGIKNLINNLDKPQSTKTSIAWISGIIGFIIVFALFITAKEFVSGLSTPERIDTNSQNKRSLAAEGFRKLKWGTSINTAKKSYPDLKEAYNTAGLVKVYVREKEDYAFGDTKLNYVYYHFNNNRFYKIEAASMYELSNEELDARRELLREHEKATKEGKKMEGISMDGMKILMLSELYEKIYKKTLDDINHNYGNCDKKEGEMDRHKECLWNVGKTRIKLDFNDCLNSPKCGVELIIENLRQRSQNLGF
jgi:large-conductance mechanosensitive channel